MLAFDKGEGIRARAGCELRQSDLVATNHYQDEPLFTGIRKHPRLRASAVSESLAFAWDRGPRTAVICLNVSSCCAVILFPVSDSGVLGAMFGSGSVDRGRDCFRP